MSRTYIRISDLRKWFPRNDPVAASVARLCILREDLKLEMLGAVARRMGKLDGNTVVWRKIYFIRGSIRTLAEIRSAIETLRRQPRFQRLLSRQPKQDREQFEQFMQTLLAAHTFIKEFRNAVAGHILQEKAAAALNSQDFDWQGILEIGETAEKVHYKFAGELLLAILLPGIPANERETKIISILKTAAALTAALGIIDTIFAMYMKDRGLL